MARRKSGGFPWRAPRCYVCSKLAVMVDEKTGDYLCVFHHQARIALREVAKNLPFQRPDPKNEAKNG